LDDLNPENKLKLQSQVFNVDLPGNGLYYCVECAKYFMNEAVLLFHRKSKVHKRRLKELKNGKYTQKDAEEAVGLKTDQFCQNRTLSIGHTT
ncbi:Bud site selection protein 20, partial [Coelomomyces lativittatus]